MRLLPEDLPLDAVTVKFRSPVTVKAFILIRYSNQIDEVAICNTEQQILLVADAQNRERVWYLSTH